MNATRITRHITNVIAYCKSVTNWAFCLLAWNRTAVNTINFFFFIKSTEETNWFWVKLWVAIRALRLEDCLMIIAFPRIYLLKISRSNKAQLVTFPATIVFPITYLNLCLGCRKLAILTMSPKLFHRAHF